MRELQSGTRLYDFGSYWRRHAGNFTSLPQYFREQGYRHGARTTFPVNYREREVGGTISLTTISIRYRRE